MCRDGVLLRLVDIVHSRLFNVEFHNSTSLNSVYFWNIATGMDTGHNPVTTNRVKMMVWIFAANKMNNIVSILTF